MLPGARLQPYHIGDNDSIDELAKSGVFIATVNLDDRTIEDDPRFRVIATRLQMIDRFNNAETLDMLTGNVARNLFKKDLLVEVPPATQ
jgi:hypothetical protein